MTDHAGSNDSEFHNEEMSLLEIGGSPAPAILGQDMPCWQGWVSGKTFSTKNEAAARSPAHRRFLRVALTFG
jgi:hypothetical protein